MRVIEQLIQHFWETGELSHTEARYLLDQGFVRNLSGWVPGKAPEATEVNERADYDGRPPDTDFEGPDFINDWPEEKLPVRRSGKGGRGKDRPRPSGHNLVPLCTALASHFAGHEPFQALVELGNRLRPSATWQEAAAAVATADTPTVERALVRLLNGRPRALGELWFWFNLEPLADWARLAANKGPVAAALAKLLRAKTLSEVGRVGQLLKAEAVQDLVALLAARRRFFAVLPALYDRHFDRLGSWLVPPQHGAAEDWLALPWAYVLLYNAHWAVLRQVPPGYAVSSSQLALNLWELAWATACQMEPERTRLLRETCRSTYFPGDLLLWPGAVERGQFLCPLAWRV